MRRRGTLSCREIQRMYPFPSAATPPPPIQQKTRRGSNQKQNDNSTFAHNNECRTIAITVPRHACIRFPILYCNLHQSITQFSAGFAQPTDVVRPSWHHRVRPMDLPMRGKEERIELGGQTDWARAASIDRPVRFITATTRDPRSSITNVRVKRCAKRALASREWVWL